MLYSNATKRSVKSLCFSLLVCLCLIPCQTTGARNIPFRIAERYFVNNNVKSLPSPKITSKEAFFNTFGCAAVMGKNGMPTSIDFSKEYVIAVVKSETDRTTTLNPISLKGNKRNVVFTYRLNVGGKQTYTIRPCLLIIVDKKYAGNVRIREVKGSRK
jgi:hypothetical protein